GEGRPAERRRAAGKRGALARRRARLHARAPPHHPGRRHAPRPDGGAHLARAAALEQLLDRADDVRDLDAPDADGVAAFRDAAPALAQPHEAALEEAVLVAAR